MEIITLFTAVCSVTRGKRLVAEGMDVRKYSGWIAFYPIAFLVAVVLSVAVIASVTNTVVFESYRFTFDQELYLEHIRNKVERLIPPVIALNSVVLLLDYTLFSRLSKRMEIERAIGFTIGMYLITFALWLSYAMFHGLSGEYPPIALAVTSLSLGNMAVCGVLFYTVARRACRRNSDRQPDSIVVSTRRPAASS